MKHPVPHTRLRGRGCRMPVRLSSTPRQRSQAPMGHDKGRSPEYTDPKGLATPLPTP
ncbi:MAG: hypothetical protein QXY01_05910 [Candidatus Bathyarchaeia archaeon]